MPLSVRLPNAIHGGNKCSRSVSLIDIYPTLLELCQLPAVKGLDGTSFLAQLHDPQTKRNTPAITTWQYNNHAARSQNFRYIRYRDGSEELYDHRTDPDENRNLANDPQYKGIKKKLRNSLPVNNVVPLSIRNGRTDSYGKRFEMLRDNGIPDWLGKVPQAVETTNP